MNLPRTNSKFYLSAFPLKYLLLRFLPNAPVYQLIHLSKDHTSAIRPLLGLSQEKPKKLGERAYRFPQLKYYTNDGYTYSE